MKLQLFLTKGTNLIQFNKNITLHPDSYIKINKGRILWRVFNVVDQTFELNSVTHTPPTGYYTFHDIKDYLESLSITVNLEKSEKVTLTPPHELNLKDFGLLLGFEKDATFSTKTTSPKIVDVHGGLVDVTVSCDRVNSLENFYMGKRSQRLFSVFVPNKNLYGRTSEYTLETVVGLQNGNFSSFEFTVEDNSFLTDKTSYSLYLDVEIR